MENLENLENLRDAEESNNVEKKVSYRGSAIDERIVRAVEEMGFETMTPIQEQSVPVLLEGKDIRYFQIFRRTVIGRKRAAGDYPLPHKGIGDAGSGGNPPFCKIYA